MISLGANVTINGLNSEDYNGATATVVSIDDDTDRVEVSIGFGRSKRNVKVKRNLLRVVPKALTFDEKVMNPIDSMRVFEINLKTEQGKRSAKEILRHVTRFDDAARAFAQARPWEHPLSAGAAVSIRLLSPDGTLLRQMYAAIVGKSGSAFGFSLFQSYAHFRCFRVSSGQDWEKSMHLYVSLESEKSLGGFKLADDPNLSALICTCHRSVPDIEEVRG